VKGVRVAQQRVSKGVTHAINERPPDQGGSSGSSLPREDAGQLSRGAGGCHQSRAEVKASDTHLFPERLLTGDGSVSLRSTFVMSS
jgi:hypothetical protein